MDTLDNDSMPEGASSQASGLPLASEVQEKTGGHARPTLVPPWEVVRRWFIANTFAPSWLSGRWSHPFFGYLVAILLQVVAVTVVTLLAQIFPPFRFSVALLILVVTIVALNWGAGPGVIATLAGAALLVLLLLPPYFPLAIAQTGDVIGMCLYLGVGFAISLAAGPITRVRTESEATRKQLHDLLTRVTADMEALRKQVAEERNQLFAREQAARGEAEVARQRMDEFLGIASHELRTPLTTIRGNIELAKRRLKAYLQELPAGNKLEEVQEMLNRAERQVRIQNRLVGDLLDISRIQAEQLDLHLESCDLAIIVRETVEDQRHAAPTRVIHYEAPGTETVPVITDADRIEQVVNNYLTNALKYSPADRPIEVQLQVEGKTARISVRDEGPGLFPEEQERVWERFYRAQGIERQRGFGVGLGLGLHISRAIIEQHQGQVGVESMPGKGSTFWFTLPLAEDDHQESL